MLRILLMVFALLLAGGSAVESQGRTRSISDDANAIELLIGIRSDLGLTDVQVARLEEIDVDVERRNSPLLVQMAEIRVRIRALGALDQMPEANRPEFQKQVAQARVVMEKIQANNLAAMRRVGEVLTERQKVQIAQLLQERGDNNRGRSSDISGPSSTGN